MVQLAQNRKGTKGSPLPSSGIQQANYNDNNKLCGNIIDVKYLSMVESQEISFLRSDDLTHAYMLVIIYDLIKPSDGSGINLSLTYPCFALIKLRMECVINSIRSFRDSSFFK